MRLIIISGILTLFLVLITFAQDKEGRSQQELMQLYMELAQPGPEHALLNKMAGTWDQEVKMWMQPGAEPTVMSSTATVESILGGRFIRMHFVAGEGMMTTEGIQILGFDRRTEEYTIVAFDTWGTYYVTAAGSYDGETSTMTLHGESYDPIMETNEEYDMVFRFEGDSTMVSEVWFKDPMHTGGDEPFKMVEVISKRVE